MELNILDSELWFPPVEEALPDGLLAIGGDLGAERLLLAYSRGIFPWYNEDEPPMWWCPDPRFVLFPDELKVSRSMRQLVRRDAFEVTVDRAFGDVISNCMKIRRKGMDGSWISGDVVTAYTEMHRLGYAHSVEAWQGGVLAGGLYGIMLGSVFFGESMFSVKANASKFAFISWVDLLKEKGVKLIDCQVHTTHLESLGARMIPRADFVELLNENIK